MISRLCRQFYEILTRLDYTSLFAGGPFMQRKSLAVAPIVAVVILAALAWTSSGQPKPAEPTLLDILRILKTKQFVDLTHAFAPGIPHWPGFPNEKRETLYFY